MKIIRALTSQIERKKSLLCSKWLKTTQVAPFSIVLIAGSKGAIGALVLFKLEDIYRLHHVSLRLLVDTKDLRNVCHLHPVYSSY